LAENVASPDTVEAHERGVFPSGEERAGWPQPWRFVFSRHNRNFGDIVNDPNRGPWSRRQPDGTEFPGHTDMAEQMVTTAEQLAWTHVFSDGVERDPGDILLDLMEFAIQWRKANQLPPSAFTDGQAPQSDSSDANLPAGEPTAEIVAPPVVTDGDPQGARPARRQATRVAKKPPAKAAEKRSAKAGAERATRQRSARGQSAREEKLCPQTDSGFPIGEVKHVN
jgi:hypothetical protein